MSDKKSEAVMVRLAAADQETLGLLARETGIKAATLARLALQAVLRDYRINKTITLPLTVTLSAEHSLREPHDLLLNDPPAEIPPMGYNLGRLPGEPPPEDPPASPAKKKSPPPKAGPAGAGAALPGSKPPASGEAPASA